MSYLKALLLGMAVALIVGSGLAGCATNVNQASMNTYNPTKPPEPPPTAYGGS